MTCSSQATARTTVIAAVIETNPHFLTNQTGNSVSLVPNSPSSFLCAVVSYFHLPEYGLSCFKSSANDCHVVLDKPCVVIGRVPPGAELKVKRLAEGQTVALLALFPPLSAEQSLTLVKHFPFLGLMTYQNAHQQHQRLPASSL